MRTKNAMQRRAQEYLDERRRLGYDPSRIGNLLLSSYLQNSPDMTGSRLTKRAR
jgi:hypothetical protein